MRYFVTPNYCVALNAKSGSTSVVKRLIDTFAPEWERRLRTAHYPAGIGPADMPLHSYMPSTATPDRPVALMVREPLDRFLSGVAYLQIDVDHAIESLVMGTAVVATGRLGGQRSTVLRRNIHFRRQADMPYGETHLFRFPDHIQDLGALLGIGPVPQLNITPRPKPPVTADQRAAILDYYAADVALFASITQPGVVVQAGTPEPPDGSDDE